MDNDQTAGIFQLRQEVANFVALREWEKFHTPENLALSISLESAELLEIFQWKLSARGKSGPVQRNESPDCTGSPYTQSEMTAMKHELADIAIYLFSFFNRMDWDLTSCVQEKMAMNKKKYPVSLYKGNFEKKGQSEP